jgi:hypothetical protein
MRVKNSNFFNRDFYSPETYSRIGLLRSHGNLQSYWTTTKLSKLTVVLDYYETKETYSRIGLLRGHGNLQSYWTTTNVWKLTVVLDYYETKETYSRIVLMSARSNLKNFKGNRLIQCFACRNWRTIDQNVDTPTGKNYTRNEWRRCKNTLETSG